jgi:hypothetical protein
VLLLDWFPIGQRCAWERPFGASRFVVMKKMVAIERPRHHLSAYDTAYSQPAGQLGCFTPKPRRCPAPSIQCRDVFEQIEDVGSFGGRHSLVLHGWSADDVG